MAYCGAKRNSTARSRSLRLHGEPRRVDNDASIQRPVGIQALRVLVCGEASEPVLLVHKIYLLALPHHVVVAHAGYNDGRDLGQDAAGDDGAVVEHGPQHPSTVLVDLKPADVPPGQRHANGCDDDEERLGGLGGDAGSPVVVPEHDARCDVAHE